MQLSTPGYRLSTSIYSPAPTCGRQWSTRKARSYAVAGKVIQENSETGSKGKCTPIPKTTPKEQAAEEPRPAQSSEARGNERGRIREVKLQRRRCKDTTGSEESGSCQALKSRDDCSRKSMSENPRKPGLSFPTVRDLPTTKTLRIKAVKPCVESAALPPKRWRGRSGIQLDDPERMMVWSDLDLTAALYLYKMEAAWAPLQALSRGVTGALAAQWRPDLKDEPLDNPTITMMMMGWKSACGGLQFFQRRLFFCPPIERAGFLTAYV